MPRVIVKNKVYVARSRREELWDDVAKSTEALKKIAESTKLDTNKVEAARDIYKELHFKLRELGVW